MADSNLNFCFYDDKERNFYKFNDVVLQLENGKEVSLSCYSRKISRETIKQNIEAQRNISNKNIDNYDFDAR